MGKHKEKLTYNPPTESFIRCVICLPLHYFNLYYNNNVKIKMHKTGK